MRVTFSPTIQTKETEYKKNLSIQNKQEKNINELPKYSIAEILGRTQSISFKGTNTIEGDYIEHICTEKTSRNGVTTEHIIFNKKNGNYTHRVTDENGGLIRSEEFFPTQEKEVITTSENDIATITTTTPSGVTIEKLDSENRQVYFEHSSENTTRIEETDYTRGRKVIKVTDHDIEQPIVVVNLETGNIVIDGELTIDTIYDEESGEYVTKNIVTNCIHKREKRDEKGNPIHAIEYNPKTGLVLKEKNYNGEYVEDTYTGENPNKLVSILYASADGREKELVFFAEDGETIISHTKLLYRKNSTLAQEIKFNAEQVMTELILYGKGESKTHHFYNEETQLKKSTKEYDKNGRLISETLFYENGKTPKAKREISSNGLFTVMHYNQSGEEVKKDFYNKDKKILYSEVYDAESKSLEKTIDYDLKTGNRTVTIFDEEYETPINAFVLSKDGTILSHTVFQEDGKTPKFKRAYNGDRSYSDYVFDKKGEVIGTKEYNSDGTKKY